MVFIFFFLLVFFSLLTKTFHFLSFLIGLEVMSILVLLSFSMILSFLLLDTFVLMFFLCLLACESALGLVLFVVLNRVFSKDYYLGMAMLKF